MNTKNNQRFQESENKIQAALMDLLKTGEMQNITIHNICRNAQINRTTFYAHFSDIRELTEKCEIALRNSLKIELRKIYSNEGNPPIGIFQIKFLQFLKEKADFYRLYFLYHSVETAQNGPSQIWLSSISSQLDNYRQVFYRAGVEAILTQWVEDGCKDSPETIQSILRWHLP